MVSPLGLHRKPLVLMPLPLGLDTGRSAAPDISLRKKEYSHVCYSKSSKSSAMKASICAHHSLMPLTSHQPSSHGSSNHQRLPSLPSLAYFLRLPPSKTWFLTPVSKTALPTSGENSSGSRKTVRWTCLAVDGSARRAVRWRYGGSSDISTGESWTTIANTLMDQFCGHGRCGISWRVVSVGVF